MGVAKMSEAIATIDTMNECYQCQEDLGYDPGTSVHPLCQDCQYEFDDWLQYEMMRFN
jgi:hypothetical protein